MKASRKTLPNGLRIVVVPMKDNPTVTVMVLVEAGSKYETKEENGLSHFLEHMCFKGTAKRPKAMDISRELDGLGAQSNAFTSHEYTGYYAKGEAKHFGRLFDVISDVYLNSTFPDAEIEKEKGVIVEEINMYEDMPHRNVQDVFMRLLYGDTPAGWPITGSRETVRSFSRKDFLRYHTRQYRPQSTVVVVAGGVHVASVVKEVEKTFGGLSRGKKDGKEKTLDKQHKPAVRLVHRATDQTHLVFGTRTFSVKDEKRNAVLAVMSTLLAGGMSSRLFQKLREEMGVCYYVRAANDPFTDHGFLEIAVGADNKRVKEVVAILKQECFRLTKELVADDELARVKEYLAGNMLLELESSDAFANFYGGQEILRRPLENPRTTEKKIRAVTKEAIRKVAREIWREETLNLAMIGPYQESDSIVFEKLLLA